jgi:hypothetical protein
MFDEGNCANPSAREYVPNAVELKHFPMTIVYMLLYVVSINADANNLLPNENISLNDFFENVHCGIHLT